MTILTEKQVRVRLKDKGLSSRLKAEIAELIAETAGGSSGGSAVVLDGSYSPAASESGSTFFLDNAAGFTVTLPSPELGLSFTFVVSAVNSTGPYVISATADTISMVSFLAYGSAADGNAASGTTLTLNTNETTGGDRIELVSDGTSWFASAFVGFDTTVSISGGS